MYITIERPTSHFGVGDWTFLYYCWLQWNLSVICIPYHMVQMCTIKWGFSQLNYFTLNLVRYFWYMKFHIWLPPPVYLILVGYTNLLHQSLFLHLPVFITGCVVCAFSWRQSAVKCKVNRYCSPCHLPYSGTELWNRWKNTATLVRTSVGKQGTPLSQTSHCACAEYSITGVVASARLRTQPTWREKVNLLVDNAPKTYVMLPRMCRHCLAGFISGLKCYVSRGCVNSEGLIGPACHAALSCCELC